MRLVTYVRNDDRPASQRVGAMLCDESIVDLASAAAEASEPSSSWFRSMLDLLNSGRPALDEAARRVTSADTATINIADLQLLSPIPRPNSIRDCLCFERHLINCMRTVAKGKFRPLASLDRFCERTLGSGFLRPPKVWYQQPLYYKGNPDTVVGHDADVLWPGYTRQLDFELEFGIFIGRRGKNIPQGRAGEYIAGYAIFNDFSARDVQLAEMAGRLGPAKGKDFDTGNAIGPWLVTPDEVPEPYNLAMTARVNGEPWCEASSREMAYSFEEIIEYISRDETLYPGDFIAAGTAPGGCGLELDRWLQPGDVVELEVENLGVLRNVVRKSPISE